MIVRTADAAAAEIAAAIGEPARSRMLFALLDGHARTSTELAILGEISLSTASVHLARLRERGLVKVQSQGKHRYYTIGNTAVANALEALAVVAGTARDAAFVPSTPSHLRAARTCYDHMAGHLAVRLRERFETLHWLAPGAGDEDAYELTTRGSEAIASLGIDLGALHALRRRFAYACVDWSERCPHIGGALGHALLAIALQRKWFTQDLDSRALRLTSLGRRELQARFGFASPDLQAA